MKGKVLTRPAEPGAGYPRYIAGENAAPPEDCGGVPGFYAQLEIRADPNHPDHQQIKEWLGDYDLEAIDEASIKVSFARLANQRRGGKALTAEEKSA